MCVVVTLVVHGLLIFGGWVASGRLVSTRVPFVRSIATAVLAWTWVTLGMQVLGSVGLLRQVELGCWVACGVLLAVALPGSWRATSKAPDLEPAGVDLAVRSPAAVVALGLTLWVCTYLALISTLLPVKVVSDGPIYHLYFAARWWKDARISLIPVPFGESAATYFPANGDLWFMWLFVLCGGDRLARIGQAPFLLLAGVVVYAAARRCGARAGAAMLATTWFVTVMPLLLFSFEANVDTIFVAGYLAGALFLMLYAQGGLGTGGLWIAGLALGLAWGTKPTATVFVPPVVLLGLIAVWRGAGGWRAALRRSLVFLCATLLPCGFWFGRSLWLTGNPLYPLHLEVVGHVVLRGWYDSSAMARSQFYIPRHIWQAAVDIHVVVFDPRMVPFWVVAVLGGWRWGRAKPRASGWVWTCAGLAVANIALFWLLIPYRTQQRFMLQAAGLAAIPLALLFERGAILRAAGVALLAIHLVTSSNWPLFPAKEQPPWSLTKFIPVNIDPPLTIPFSAAGWREALARNWWQSYPMLRLFLFAACIPVSWLLCRAAARKRLIDLIVAATSSMGVLVAGAAWLWWGIGASNVAYPMFEYYDGWTALEMASGTRGTRVAYAGTNIPFYLMGKDLRNAVQYVGIDEHADWLPHDYHADAVRRGDRALWDTPRPGWDRIHPDFEAWVENLRREGIRVLVVARANRNDGPFNLADRDDFPVERVWADAHPEWFVPLHGVQPPDPRLKVYSVRIPDANSTDRVPRRH